MGAHRLGWGRLLAVVGLGALTLGVGLGRSGRLSYHEAFVAQAAREMLASGNVLVPTVGGQPWLEKPPLATWLVAFVSGLAGGVTETTARVPSALAALALCVAVALLAARRYGAAVGLLAGLTQATTMWTVGRGRLADADILLAALVTWTLLAFDHLRERDPDPESNPEAAEASRPVSARDPWRWAFFVCLGLTGLAKGVGFGAVLLVAAIGLALIWDRDRATLRRLGFGRGWIVAGVIGLTWPVLVALRHPSVIGLWYVHVSDRLSSEPEQFTGQPTWVFWLALLAQVLPWTPLAVVGAWRSIPRAFGSREQRRDHDLAEANRAAGDRLLWAWLVGPLFLLSMATVKNAHYAIHALPPCSIWAALGLPRLGELLQLRGPAWTYSRVRLGTYAGFVTLGLAYGLGFAFLGPWVDRRGVEWGFYETAAAKLKGSEPLVLLYHVPEWDRAPYPTPFGPVPHDWAVRLFYLGRPASPRFGLDALRQVPVASPTSPYAVIGRPSDASGLSRLGRVETLARGPEIRSDRTYVLYRVTPAIPIAAGSTGRTRR